MKITLTPYDKKFDFTKLCILCGKAHNKTSGFLATEYSFWKNPFGKEQIKNIQYDYCNRNGCYSSAYTDDKVWARRVAFITRLRIR